VNPWDEILNRISDSEMAWWPFAFLRPSKRSPMSSRLILIAAVLYGAPAGLLINIVLAASGSPIAQWPFVAPLAFIVALFLFHRLTFARAWNRRAARLAPLVGMTVACPSEDDPSSGG
jgi:hypothetical protein